ncbi:hypothetical protein LEMLEM_LOCUS24871, partial [Lemmus lemmus]
MESVGFTAHPIHQLGTSAKYSCGPELLYNQGHHKRHLSGCIRGTKIDRTFYGLSHQWSAKACKQPFKRDGICRRPSIAHSCNYPIIIKLLLYLIY